MRGAVGLPAFGSSTTLAARTPSMAKPTDAEIQATLIREGDFPAERLISLREQARAERERGEEPPARHIVTISSLSGFGHLGQANYSAAKAGIAGLTRTVALEGASFNVLANSVAFGVIDTRLTRPREGQEERVGQAVLGIPREQREKAVELVPLKRVGTVDEAVGPVLFLCSDLANYTTGALLEVNDITAAQAMPIEAAATYVFDLGYYDFGWWAKLDAAGCRIVTRFKSNTPLAVTAELDPPVGGDILSDRIGLLPRRQKRNRKNPFSDPVREVRLRTDTGKVLRILCNDLDASAREIADLYKRRWAIELFFRWVKQTLKIRHFLGNSENAVRIQIAVALIAYLLIRLAQADQKTVKAPLAFARLIRVNLMHRKRIDRLLAPDPEPKEKPNQMALQGI